MSNLRTRAVAAGCLLFTGLSSASIYLDPIGDNQLPPDLTAYTVEYNATTLFVSASFVPGSIVASEFTLAFGIDVDANPATGSPAAIVPGADVFVSYSWVVRPASVPQGWFYVTAYDPAGSVTRVTGIGLPLLAPDFAAFAVPLSVIGDPGGALVGTVVGVAASQNLSLISDHSGISYPPTLGPGSFGTPAWAYDPNFQPVDEAPTALLLATGALAILGFRRRRAAARSGA